MLSLLPQSFKISLRLVLIVPLILQIITIGGVTGYLSWRNGQQTVKELADRLMHETTARISDRLERYLQIPHQLLDLNRLAHSNGNLELTDFQQLEQYFWQQLNVFEGITAIGFGNQNGQHLALGIDRGGVLGVANAKFLGEANLSNTDIENIYQFYLLDEQSGDRLKPLKTVPNYDSRQLHWYQTAQTAEKPTWTKIVPYFVVPEASLFAVTPMYQNGLFEGVMFVNLMLEDISRFLNRLDFSPDGRTFIIERSGDLVATSTQEKPFIKIKDLNLKRLPAIDSDDPLTGKAVQSLVTQQIELAEIDTIYHFQFKSDRQEYFAQITPYQDAYGLDWLIVVMVPESDFIAEIVANSRQTLWLSLGAMGFAIIIGTAIAEWISRPIRSLSQNSAAMARGDLNQQMPEHSPIVEIDRMTGSFNQMATQLRQSFESVQTALAQSEVKYKTIFQNSPDAILLTNLEDGRWIDFNECFLQVTGYTRDEAIAQTAAGSLHILGNSQQTEQILQQLQTTGVIRNQEVYWHNKFGELKISLVSCEIIKLDGQSYILSISKEISDLKRVQTALADSEARLRELTENLPIFLGLRTANHDRWLYVSPGFEKITGGKAQELYDNPLAWQKYIHADDLEQLLANKPLPYPTEPWTTEIRIVCQNGDIRWMRTTLYPIRDETGNIYRVCTISQDISDRKTLELALQSSQRKLNEIINTPIAAIFRLQIFANREWEFDYISAGCEEIFGYSAEEFTADRSIWMANIHPQDLETTILPLFEEIFQETTTRFEYRFIHKNGQLRWLSAQFVAKYDRHFDCWFVNQFTVDISDRKQVELALAQQQQQEQVLNQAIQNIHQSLDLSTIFDRATRGIAQLLELDRAVIARYLPDREVWRHISTYRQDPQMPDDLGLEVPDRGNPLAAQLKQNLVVKIEDTNTIADPINRELARERPGAWLLVPLIVNGSIWGSLSIWKNNITCWSNHQIDLARRITQPLGIAIHQANLYQQSQDAKAALKHSEARYRAIVEDQTELIVRYQPDGILTFVNQAFCRYVGRSAQELLGHHYNPVIYEGDRDYVNQQVRKLSRDNPVVFIENRAIVGDEIRWTQWINRIIFDSQETLIEIQAVGRDITELKQAEMVLKKAKESAETANRTKSEFLANMSHEIRTPLNAILGFTDLLSRKGLHPDYHKYLNSISNSGRTLLALINDILDLSKIEAGKLTLNYQSMNLHDLLVEVQQIFDEQAHQKSLLICLEICDPVPQMISFDEVRLRQILFNLVGNAIKFTEQGSVRIRLNSQPGEPAISNQVNLEISVEDTGIGIASDQKEHIFDAFVQINSKSTRKYGGTGLGLAITKRLTHLLGGTVNVVSQLGQGTTFTLMFPKIQALESINNSIDINTLHYDLNQFTPMTILAVDDVESNLELIAEYFWETKHHLLLARDGIEAIELVRDHSIDLILLDVRMPNMNGLEVAEHLKSHLQTQAIPIIFVTAYSKMDHESLVRSYADGFIRKPFLLSELVAELQKVLNVEPSSQWVSEAVSETVEPSKVFTPNSEVLAKLPQLVEKLQGELDKVWLELCRSQKQREIKAFVSRLQAWAEDYQCQELWDYAERLGTELEQFDWDNLPRTLKEFSGVLKKISAEVFGD